MVIWDLQHFYMRVIYIRYLHVEPNDWSLKGPKTLLVTILYAVPDCTIFCSRDLYYDHVAFVSSQVIYFNCLQHISISFKVAETKVIKINAKRLHHQPLSQTKELPWPSNKKSITWRFTDFWHGVGDAEVAYLNREAWGYFKKYLTNISFSFKNRYWHSFFY